MLLQEKFPDTTSANPRLGTIKEITTILENESLQDAMPLSLAEIGRRMRAKKTRPEVIRAVVQLLEAMGVALRGTKGVIFTRVSPDVRRQPSVDL